MTAEEQRALLAVALLAAFADGDKSEPEREEIKRIAASLGSQAAGLNIPALMQDVLLRRLGLPQAVAAVNRDLHSYLARRSADLASFADGDKSEPERQFLA